MLSAKGLALGPGRLQDGLKLHQVVLKPFSPSQLVATVHACLKERAGVA